jgi:hypothetical protein
VLAALLVMAIGLPATFGVLGSGGLALGLQELWRRRSLRIRSA